MWFVVGLPVFLYAQGWKYMEVAGFIAAWTIGYGLVQAIAPMVVRRSPDGLSREIPEARLWGAVLTAIPVALVLLLQARLPVSPGLLVVIGLGVFGFAFAVISSLHSYLILAYAGSKKAAEDVGFYYAANAAGRLFGILLSGALTQYGGLSACLWGSAAMLAICLALVFLLPAEIETRRGIVAAAEQTERRAAVYRRYRFSDAYFDSLQNIELTVLLRPHNFDD